MLDIHKTNFKASVKNKSKSALKYEGKVFSSNNYGDFKVIEYKSAQEVLIEFIDTGFQKTVQMSKAKIGNVKDELGFRYFIDGIGFKQADDIAEHYKLNLETLRSGPITNISKHMNERVKHMVMLRLKTTLNKVRLVKELPEREKIEKERLDRAEERRLSQLILGEFSCVSKCYWCGKYYEHITNSKNSHIYSTRNLIGSCSDDCRDNGIAIRKKQYKKEYIAKNGKCHNYKVKETAKYQQGITAKKLAIRDGMKCCICKRRVEKHRGDGWQPRGWSVGHIIARANGGDHTWENVQLECIECNVDKGARDEGQLSLGFTV